MSKTNKQRMKSNNSLASVVFFLSSEASSYVNGQTIAIDGGKKKPKQTKKG